MTKQESFWTEPGRVERTAKLSPCQTWRYTLGRRWGTGPTMVLAMLNPSTADALRDDNTVRRGMALADASGFKALHVVNPFAYRTKSPSVLAEAIRKRRLWAQLVNVRRGAEPGKFPPLTEPPDPVGPENPDAWAEAAKLVSRGGFVVGWGGNGMLFPATIGRMLRVFQAVAGGGPFGPQYLGPTATCRIKAFRRPDGLTIEGHPMHPLYLPSSWRPRPWPLPMATWVETPEL